MASDLSAPPVLSTPAELTFAEDFSAVAVQAERPHRSDDELFQVYEVARTANEIQTQGWKRIALQFPDAMLPDAPWVVDALGKELGRLSEKENTPSQVQGQRLYILADTSYSACCVDEIAAEHADADAVVHYGRACLSPTARLPVLHVFTRQKLDYDAVVEAFEKEFQDKADNKVIVMADVMFQEHVGPVCELLRTKGYTHVVATEIAHDPSGTIPNRKLLPLDSSLENKAAEREGLHDHHLFHISTPPTSLLLTLSSRLASLRIYATPSSPYTTASELPDPSATPSMLRRRYALVIRLATASIIGILVNTLSVKNYMSTISKLREQIATAGKKSYTIVVGKLNTAKLANFAEVDGWVVVGCWESGLVEQDGLWKPVITPFELGLALQGEETRVWTGEWWAGIEGAKSEDNHESGDAKAETKEEEPVLVPDDGDDVAGGVDDEESEPPEFDLRTGKLVSHSRPMRVAIRSAGANGAQSNGSDDAARSTPRTLSSPAASAIVKRAAGEVALVNGVVSPGAQFLRSQRTWQGLGSDFNTAEEDEEVEESSTLVEEGRSGIARGYAVGEEGRQRT
ncbi:putative diphthamide synthesis protein-domain-containing protein [Biscogniauxia mediterranea]|nr:putative diphthamide synthesis protein-domain-containing protein [Biscogniauxia mediterranea]